MVDSSPPFDAALIERAAELLRTGGVVAFPTETVYGLGANATDPRAVARVFEIKGRPRFDPLIVHAADVSQVRALVVAWPEAAARLAARFWPGPLTLVLPKQAGVPDIVTAGLASVAVRVPTHPVALELIRRAGLPIAAPSANRFGAISPTTAAHVRHDLGDDVDMILDGGACEHGLESTVVSLLDHPSRPATLLRPGATPAEEIEKIVGALARPVADEKAGLSPGMLPRHYAPRTRVLLHETPGAPPSPPTGSRAGLLVLREPGNRGGYEAVEVLSRSGDLREAAANLFAAMRRLDALGLDLIVAGLAPEAGLGRAINDRLRRASVREG